MTVLEFVQRVLSALDLEGATSIDETVESEQIKMILDAEYEKLSQRFDWCYKTDMVNLNITPTKHKLEIPDNVDQIDWFKYNRKEVHYIEPKEMIDILDERDLDNDNVDENGALTNKDPVFYTIIGEQEVLVDSYNGSLVSQYTNCGVWKQPAPLLNDTDIIDIPEVLVTALYSGVLERGFREMKGDEQSARAFYNKHVRDIIHAKRWADKAYDDRDPRGGLDYGRKR